MTLGPSIFPEGGALVTIEFMDDTRFQWSLGALLVLVACVALNLWLFRLGALAGLFGLNLTRHVAVAYLCRVAGVNRTPVEVPSQGRPGPHRPPEGWTA